MHASLGIKSLILNDYFIDKKLDFLYITESWIVPGEFSIIAELLPDDCVGFKTPRTTDHGGGLLTIFHVN